MKKLLAILMALTLVLTVGAMFVGCEPAENETEAPTETPTEGGAEKTVLKMGTNAYFQPYEYYDGDKIVGIDAEIAKFAEQNKKA